MMSMEAMQRNRDILKVLTGPELDRYEAYRRGNFTRSVMKKLLQQVLQTTLSLNVVITMSGIAKLFVGELIETARMIAHERGHTGALLPEHVHEAYQLLDSRGRVPHRSRRGRH